MPIRVTCLSCGEKNSIADTTTGKSIRCKGCGESIRVSPSTATRDAPRATPSSKVKKSQSRAKFGKSKGVGSQLWIFAGVGGCAVIMIAVTSWLVVGQSGDRPTESAEGPANTVVTTEENKSASLVLTQDTPESGPTEMAGGLAGLPFAPPADSAAGKASVPTAAGPGNMATPVPPNLRVSDAGTLPVDPDPELDRHETDIQNLVKMAKEQSQNGNDMEALKRLQALDKPLSDWLKHIQLRKSSLEHEIEVSGPLRELKGRTFPTPQDLEREVLPLRRKVDQEQQVRLAQLIAGQTSAQEAIAALRQDDEPLAVPWSRLTAVCADWSRRRGVLEESLNDAFRLASEIQMRQSSQDFSTTVRLQRQIIQLTGARQGHAPFRFGTAALSYRTTMARVESEWVSTPVFEIAGNSALELLSGGEDGKSLAGIDLLLGLPVRSAKSLTLSLMEMEEPQWRMVSQWSSVDTITLQRSVLSREIPEGLTLPKVETLTLNGGTIAPKVLASLLAKSRPKELVLENVTIEGDGAGGFPLDRLATVRIAGSMGAGRLLRAIIDANVTSDLSVDQAIVSSVEWQLIERMSSLKKLTIRSGQGPIEVREGMNGELIKALLARRSSQGSSGQGSVEVRAEQMEPLAKSPNLEELWVFDGVEKNAANAVAALRQLRVLHLPNLAGHFRWSNLPQPCSWQVLRMSGDFELSDDLLQELGQCTELREIGLHAAWRIERGASGSETLDRTTVPPAGDIGLASIARLPNLESLSLSPTDVTDKGLSLLHKHPQLKMVRMSSEQISAKAPAVLADSLPQLRDPFTRRRFFIAQGPHDYASRSIFELSVIEPIRAGEKPFRNWIEGFWLGRRETEICWLPGTPKDSVVAMKDGSLSLRELLDQLTVTTRTSWDFDGERIYVFPSEVDQRIRRRLDQQPELMLRSRRVEALRWLTQVPQPFDVNGASLGDLIRQFASTYKAPADAIVIDSKDAKLASRKVTLVVPGIRRQGASIISQLDFMVLTLGLDWTIDSGNRVVLKSANDR